jgi:hypothetical protein
MNREKTGLCQMLNSVDVDPSVSEYCEDAGLSDEEEC